MMMDPNIRPVRNITALKQRYPTREERCRGQDRGGGGGVGKKIILEEMIILLANDILIKYM